MKTKTEDVIKPPLGVTLRKIHDEKVKLARFADLCGAIYRYYNSGRKIPIEWIEEYNELIEGVKNHYSNYENKNRP